MPPAIVTANMGGVFASMQQAQQHKANMLAQLAQHQNQLQQGQTILSLAQYQQQGLANALSQQMNAVGAPNVIAWHHRQRAESYAKDGERLIDRMAFWDQIPVIGDRIVDRLADALERVAERIETELERA